MKEVDGLVHPEIKESGVESHSVVYKFGGTSLKDATAIRQVAQIIQASLEPTLVVVSAMGGLTDLMLKAAKQAAVGELSEMGEAIAIFKKRQIDAIDLLVSPHTATELRKQVDHSAQELFSLCESIGILRELTDRTLAKVLSRGERLMAKLLVEVLKAEKLNAVHIDATELLKVVPSGIGMMPDMAACEVALKNLAEPLLAAGKVVVVPGFIAEGRDNQLVLLGRGGSDFSAAILAAGLHAKRLVLFKEVDGILTADPRHVDEARIVRHLHYREAAELAYYGAKILHPGTIIPLIERSVPLEIRNTFSPQKEGTLISGAVQSDSSPVKALTAIPDQAVIAIEGNGMMGVPGIAGRTFSCLARGEVSVSMISQASSESSICFVVPGEQAVMVKSLLEQEFKFEIAHRIIDDVKVKAQKAIIAMVGLGMSGKRGTASRAFSAMAREGINLDAIAQGSSELNISVVIENHHMGRALRSLHREFRLEKKHALPDLLGEKVSIAILGFGQIGQTLAQQISHQREYFQNQLNSEVHIVSLSDSSGSTTSRDGFTGEEIDGFVGLKSQKKKLVDGGSRKSLSHLASNLREQLWSLPFAKGIFVDCTAEDTAPLVLEAIKSGMHVVLANKRPLAVPYEEYQDIFDSVKSRGLSLRYEATVGAGLPVLDTIAKLENAGDVVQSVFGCLSGTLGYLLTQVEDGMLFSQAVKKAYELGYTEPDPRDDLSGMDVARKALILARTLGMRIELTDIELEPLYLPELDHNEPNVFLNNLEKMDDKINQMVAKAHAENKVLRYVARLAPMDVSVKIEAIAKDSPLGRLRGTDNQITLVTKRYQENPLIVTGPGAGADVTAAGVLNDIVAITTAQ